MESTINLIDNYLNKSLSDPDIELFENKLNTDSDFKSTYTEHVLFLEGIERTQLKVQIDKAKTHYLRMKWLKIGALIAIIGLTAILIISFINSQKATDENLQITNEMNTSEQVELEAVVLDTVYHNIKSEMEEQPQEDIIVNNKSTEAVLETLPRKRKPEKSQIPKVEGKQIVTATTLITNNINMESFFESVQKEPEVARINSQDEVTLNLKEGTKIVIPAQSFIDEKTRQPITGLVDFAVTEYYELSDILLANLSTRCDDNLLETGGMLYIEATLNGNKLALKEDKSLKITFNTDKEDMSLFNGEVQDDNNVNWKLAQEPEVVEELAPNEDVTIPFSIIDVAPTYPGCKDLNDEERRNCTNENIKRFYSKYFDSSLINSKKSNYKEKIGIVFDIDRKGNVVLINIKASTQELEDEAVRVTNLIPQMIPGSHKGIPVNVRFGIPLTISLNGDDASGIASKNSKSKFKRKPNKQLDSVKFILDGTVSNQIRPDSVNSSSRIIVVNGFENQLPESIKLDDELKNAIKQNADTVSGFISSVDKNLIERYAFSSSQLGWINCDRFTRLKGKKVKMRFKVKNADGSKIKMVFKSISAVLPSTESNGTFDFGYVPQNENVVLIAIKKEGDSLFLAQEELKTKSISILNLEFEPVTIKALKQRLQELNKTF